LLARFFAGLLEKIRSISPSAWKVLVVDDYTRELLEEVMNVNEILNLNVTGQPKPISSPSFALLLASSRSKHLLLASQRLFGC